MNESIPDEVELTLTVTLNGFEHSGLMDPDKSLLENIEALQLPIRSACRRGLCGSCRVQLVSGELHPEKRLLVNGFVLACSSILISNANVIISY